ncbi:hypothetical protein LL14B4_10580 [Lactococcus lactis subsp. lactis]|uniref:Uncharacterized protein n=1 Tax=Lactococcus lactis subsp. lactis TaxID=1360 RepID=A0A2Z3KGH1_LACLL|nr:hypothetical protein [Lactococcus lactis]AWN66597.1 hypothetical protein LL14B4_10580 [Lactococcus lactis subsp. lactis]
MSTDNVPTPRYSASEVLRNQKHFFQLDERLLLVFSPEQYMFINRLDFWIQQKLQTQLANGEPVRGWVEDEQRMYIFKTLKSSRNQLVPSWLEEFYHFSESTFTRVIKSLVQAKIVLKRDDKNKISKDKTLWYSLDYEALDRYYSEQFVKKWQAVIVTRITWELKKWLDFNPKVEDSTLTEFQRKKKAFNSEAKAQAKIRAEQLVLNYKDFNEAIINDEINETVKKILYQLEQETFGNSLGCQNDGSDAVKMAAALTIYNQTNITNNNDTNRYGKTLTTQDYFIQGSNHSFFTPRTVVELSRIGENAKDYQDIIFRTKKKIEKKYELLVKFIPQSSKTPQVNGEFWSEDLENELIKYHFAIKEAERKGQPIKNPKGYFVSQMNRFWLAALDTEFRVSLTDKSLIQLKEDSKSQPGHFLQERFSNQKFNEKELTSDLQFLQSSMINYSDNRSTNLDIPIVGPWS